MSHSSAQSIENQTCRRHPKTSRDRIDPGDYAMMHPFVISRR